MTPDRSDAHLPPEEAARIERETREYFDQIAPKRPPKPSRSDCSSDPDLGLDLSNQDQSIPEFEKLRNLEANPQAITKLVCEGSEVVEDYVETEYYKDLNCIDKQHHTTGTGFIKVENSGESGVDLSQAVVLAGASVHKPAYIGNPATNDWIPSADPVIPASNKPGRSDP